MGAFIIKHPDQGKDDKAIYQAGLESVVNAYESMLKEKKEAKNDFLDGLAEKKTKVSLGSTSKIF